MKGNIREPKKKKKKVEKDLQVVQKKKMMRRKMDAEERAGRAHKGESKGKSAGVQRNWRSWRHGNLCVISVVGQAKEIGDRSAGNQVVYRAS